MSSTIRKHAIPKKRSVRQPVFALLLSLSACAAASRPAAVGSWKGAEHLDAAIEQAVAEGTAPGAVVVVESRGRILHHKAYGRRSLFPDREEITADTIFDCASLTKVVATAPAVMMLVEEGKVRLDDRLTRYLPDFRGSAADYGSASLDALLGTASGSRHRTRMERVRDGHRPRLRREAGCPRRGHALSTATSITFCWPRSCARFPESVSMRSRGNVFSIPCAWSTRAFCLPQAGVGASLRQSASKTEPSCGESSTTPRRGSWEGSPATPECSRRRTTSPASPRMMLNGGQLDGARILSPLSVLQMNHAAKPRRQARPGHRLGHRFSLRLAARRSFRQGFLRPYGIHRDLDVA